MSADINATKEGKNTTPHPVDIDTLLKRSENLDCYDDDVVSVSLRLSSSYYNL